MIAAHFAAAGLAAAAPEQAREVDPFLPVEQVARTQEALPEALPDPAFGSAPEAADSDSSPLPAAEPDAGAETSSPVAANYPADDPLLAEIKLPDDPLEGFNRISFGFSWAVDKVVIRPLAMTYRHVVPKPARDGARNALDNVAEPLVFANDLLQLKPKRALRTLGRFIINSTIGVFGLFDIAKRKPFNLPRRVNTFGDTLGYYGVGPGPYIYIPILGPTTLRDVADNAQGFAWPGPAGSPFDRTDYAIATTAIDGIDRRERTDDEIEAMFRNSIDKYASFRANYLQDRQGEIEALKAKDGEDAANPAFDDPLTDPAVSSPVAPEPADPPMDRAAPPPQ